MIADLQHFCSKINAGKSYKGEIIWIQDSRKKYLICIMGKEEIFIRVLKIDVCLVSEIPVLYPFIPPHAFQCTLLDQDITNCPKHPPQFLQVNTPESSCSGW